MLKTRDECNLKQVFTKTLFCRLSLTYKSPLYWSQLKERNKYLVMYLLNKRKLLCWGIDEVAVHPGSLWPPVYLQCLILPLPVYSALGSTLLWLALGAWKVAAWTEFLHAVAKVEQVATTAITIAFDRHCQQKSLLIVQAAVRGTSLLLPPLSLWGSRVEVVHKSSCARIGHADVLGPARTAGRRVGGIRVAAVILIQMHIVQVPLHIRGRDLQPVGHTTRLLARITVDVRHRAQSQSSSYWHYLARFTRVTTKYCPSKPCYLVLAGFDDVTCFNSSVATADPHQPPPSTGDGGVWWLKQRYFRHSLSSEPKLQYKHWF